MRAGISTTSTSWGARAPRSTGTGKPNGWHHNPAFQRALALAEADLRAWFHEHALTEALEELRRGAGDAARMLRSFRQKIVDANGDR